MAGELNNENLVREPYGNGRSEDQARLDAKEELARRIGMVASVMRQHGNDVKVTSALEELARRTTQGRRSQTSDQ